MFLVSLLSDGMMNVLIYSCRFYKFSCDNDLSEDEDDFHLMINIILGPIILCLRLPKFVIFEDTGYGHLVKYFCKKINRLFKKKSLTILTTY